MICLTPLRQSAEIRRALEFTGLLYSHLRLVLSPMENRQGHPASRSRPQLPVQGTILNRLGNVIAGNRLRARQIRDGSRDFQDPVVGARAQIQIRHRILEQLLRRLVQFAELLQLA